MMIQRSGRPIARAPSIYSSLRMAITWPRVSRAKIGIAERPMAIIAFVRLGPKNAPSAIAMIRNGQASKASIKREITPSHIFWK